MFERSELVRFHHCDPAGIVFYPRYVEMINATVEDWFADRVGIPFAEIHVARNVAIPVVSLSIEFSAPSRLGEVLSFGLIVQRLGSSSVTLEIRAHCEEEVRLAAKLTLVFIDKADMRPKPWPDDFKAGMSLTRRAA